MYRCKNCKHRFTARKIPTVIYPAKTIIAALSYFNTGHTLDKTRQYISRRFKQKVPISTLKDWTDRYTNEFPGIRLRKHYTLNPREVIRTRKLYHPQLYEFKVHSLKLNIANKRIPKLRPFIYEALDQLNDNIFQSSTTLRVSELAPKLPTPNYRHRSIENSPACRMADLALELCRTKRERHARVEEFMLINDSATVAVELPVWVTAEEAEMVGLPAQTITGHIDLVQVRNDQVYILDYKPDEAEKNYTATQLDLYGTLLSVRTGIPKNRINLAWFDEREYLDVEMK